MFFGVVDEGGGRLRDLTNHVYVLEREREEAQVRKLRKFEGFGPRAWVSLYIYITHGSVRFLTVVQTKKPQTKP